MRSQERMVESRGREGMERPEGRRPRTVSEGGGGGPVWRITPHGNLRREEE